MDIIDNYYFNTNDGFLEIVLGSMYSGKTSRLIETYYKCLSCDIPCIVINHSDDIRYHNTQLSNHNQIMIDCLQYNKLQDLYTKLLDNCTLRSSRYYETFKGGQGNSFLWHHDEKSNENLKKTKLKSII